MLFYKLGQNDYIKLLERPNFVKSKIDNFVKQCVIKYVYFTIKMQLYVMMGFQ